MRPDDALFAIVPCTGFLTFFAIIFGTLIVVRWFRHRELVAMAEKGLLPEQLAEQAAARRSGSRGFLVWGAVLTGLGLALFLGILPTAIVDVGDSPLLIVGLVPLFLGLGLLIVYFVTRKEDKAAAAEAAEETDVAAG
jgi:ribose/xylose/arabinose/galactoside ABC-type transport system permease subunit